MGTREGDSGGTWAPIRELLPHTLMSDSYPCHLLILEVAVKLLYSMSLETLKYPQPNKYCSNGKSIGGLK